MGDQGKETSITDALFKDELARTVLNSLSAHIAILDQDGPPLSEAYEFDELLGKMVDLVIDGGMVYPDPSTIIDFSGDEPEILRLGKGDISQFYV